MHAMPLMIGVLCAMAIAYRYYSAFLAAKVAVLDDTRITPALQHDDGQNFHPTNRWVLFGHHFAAISGAGPLIGPVLAAQFGYLPGLLWIVIGVCLAGAVQDFLVLSASIRRGGRSLAQIAFEDIGKVAGWASMLAILFIIVIALAGLGKVVVKALGGEAVKLPIDARLVWPAGSLPSESSIGLTIPPNSELKWNSDRETIQLPDAVVIRLGKADAESTKAFLSTGVLSAGSTRNIFGSSWGTFTIACTIPIALLVGFYMYRIRKGAVLEASIIGGILTLIATFLGGWVATHSVGAYFNLSANQVVWSMAIYGFVASVLPVWVLLAPRDYLSSFLKIGTIILLVGGVLIANPKLEAPAINHVFLSGGPTVAGKIFPFLFITVMCGAISGFHSLVSSGTTPKMITRERDARMIGYGAMLIEGLVGVVAMIAAAALPVQAYYDMNTDLSAVPKWHDKILEVSGGGGIEHVGQYESLTQESLRGRTGGAVTLAVGMAQIFDHAFHGGQWLWKYWYHFAIMFEALFILTTIDAGTRVGRFLLQELFGKLHPSLGRPDWLPGSLISTGLIVAGWTYFLLAPGNTFAVIWAMFGVANQMLAVIALAIVSAYLWNTGKAKYLWVTVGPMMVVMTTTSTAAVQMLIGQIDGFTTQWNNGSARNLTVMVNAAVQGSLIASMLLCTMIVIISAGVRMMSSASAPREVALTGDAAV